MKGLNVLFLKFSSLVTKKNKDGEWQHVADEINRVNGKGDRTAYMSKNIKTCPPIRERKDGWGASEEVQVFRFRKRKKSAKCNRQTIFVT
jgi:hypothetical protein